MPEFSIDYGGFVCGKGTARPLHKVHLLDDSPMQATVKFQACVFSATEADFATDTAAFEAAFRKPRQNLVVYLNTTVLKTYSQTANTGFDAEPKWEKLEEHASGRGRLYQVSITFGRPADNYSTSGRRDSAVLVSYGPQRKRTITISGTYTALSSNTARQQYQASIDAYAAAVLSTLSVASAELVGEPVAKNNDTDKICEFERVYNELIYEEPATYVVDQNLTITIEHNNATGFTPASAIVNGMYDQYIKSLFNGVLPPLSGYLRSSGIPARIDRLVNISVHWEAFIDKTVTQALKSAMEGTIRAWAIRKVADFFTGTVVLNSDAKIYEPVQNKLALDMQLLGVTGNIFDYTMNIRIEDDSGEQLQGLWSAGVLDAEPFQGKGTVMVRFTEKIVARQGARLPTAPGRPNNAIKRPGSFDETPVQWGLQGNTILATQVNRETVYQLYTKSADAQAPAAGGGIQGDRIGL